MSEAFPANEFCSDNQAAIEAATAAIDRRIDDDPEHAITVTRLAGQLAIVAGHTMAEELQIMGGRDAVDEAKRDTGDAVAILRERLIRKIGNPKLAADPAATGLYDGFIIPSGMTHDSVNNFELPSNDADDQITDGPNQGSASRVTLTDAGAYDHATLHKLHIREADTISTCSFTTVDRTVISAATKTNSLLNSGIYLLVRKYFDADNDNRLLEAMSGHFADEAELEAMLEARAAGHANRSSLPKTIAMLKEHCINAKASREMSASVGLDGPDLRLIMRLPQLLA
jgi:hypothetical protein